MKNLDSLTLKFFFEENENFFNFGVIQKIQMPTRYEIIFYIRNNGENRKFYININPKYPHISFMNDKSDYSVTIPKTPPMFCMQLRKYLEGAKIRHANLVPYDRILEFYFSVSDEFGIENALILSIEIMGKYSNVILYDKKTGIILGSCHNVSEDKSSFREVFGGAKYIYPKAQEKSDILKVSYSTFLEKSNDVPNNFFYFSKPFYEFLSKKANSKEELFKILQNAVFEKDLLKEFWGLEGDFSDILLKYYSNIVNSELIQAKKRNLEKNIKSKLKGINLILNTKVDEEKFEKYKKSGDLILSYIYLIEKGAKFLEIDGFKVELNPDLPPALCAQKYYKLYSKLKSAKAVQEQRAKNALYKKEYLEGVLFSIQNADNLKDLIEIEEEILEKKDKKIEKPIMKPILYGGFEIYLGKNNKQNDFLIKKISTPEDIWLHAQNSPSSHLIIKTQNGKLKVPNDVLLFCAKLVKENSPYKNSSKGIIIYTKRKYIKRPPDTPLGYVTYREEKEIIV